MREPEPWMFAPEEWQKLKELANRSLIRQQAQEDLERAVTECAAMGLSLRVTAYAARISHQTAARIVQKASG